MCSLKVVSAGLSQLERMAMMRPKDFDVPTPLKLSAAWAATVLCYIYCDYFELYVPGKIQHMLDGAGPFGTVSQWTLLGAGVQIGRASCRERVCQYVSISVVAGSLKKN